MNRSLSAACTTFAFALTVVSAGAAEPGYADLGKFKASADCEFVEVTLGAPLLKFASVVAAHHDPQAAALIRNLKHVRVNVVGYDDSTRAETTAHVQGLRHDLEAQGWTQTVTVRGAGQSEDVVIYVKTAADDSIEGLVVTVLDSNDRHAVVVNLVGNINPEQISALAKGLNLECLSHLPVKTPGEGA